MKQLLWEIFVGAFLTPAVMVTIVLMFKKDPNFLPEAFEQIDRNANEQFQAVLNKELIQPGGYQFGDPKHTISYGIGRNRITHTLSVQGKMIDRFLDRIQIWHTLRIVKHEEGRCDQYCTRPYKDHF